MKNISTVNMKHFDPEKKKKNQWNILLWFSKEPSMWNEAESTVKPILPSDSEIIETNPFEISFVL